MMEGDLKLRDPIAGINFEPLAPQCFEIEFAYVHGETYAMTAIAAEHLRVLPHRPSRLNA